MASSCMKGPDWVSLTRILEYREDLLCSNDWLTSHVIRVFYRSLDTLASVEASIAKLRRNGDLALEFLRSRAVRVTVLYHNLSSSYFFLVLYSFVYILSLSSQWEEPCLKDICIACLGFRLLFQETILGYYNHHKSSFLPGLHLVRRCNLERLIAVDHAFLVVVEAAANNQFFEPNLLRLNFFGE